MHWSIAVAATTHRVRRTNHSKRDQGSVRTSDARLAAELRTRCENRNGATQETLSSGPRSSWVPALIRGCAGSKCLLARFDDMRVASLTSLILLATVSAPLAAPYRIDSRHHQEGRPDAATLVPPDWRLQRDEQRYVSPDGSSWFAPHASSVGSEPIARHMDRIARQEGETVTYFRRESDWIAVSGFKAGRIFYRKAVLACGGKIWHHIEFEYPAALKRRMDPFVNRASYSIDHAETTDCREPQ